MSIEEWTEAGHVALIERLMDRGASKTPMEYAAMKEILRIRAEHDSEVALVAAAEREACAELVGRVPYDFRDEPDDFAERIAAIIRAGGMT